MEFAEDFLRRKSIYKSAAAGLLEEAVALICGFVLPRMILVYFGSAYNGIVAAVTQFIGCIALLRSGIGMATKAALYKPLYDHDQRKIDGIMSATMSFLRKVASIFVVGIVIFACVYPFFVEDEFSWSFVFSLVLIVSLGTFFQYYFGLGNQLLLEADQKHYIVSIVAAFNAFFNMLVSVICMKAGMNIHGVKLCSAFVYCSTPVLLYLYVNRVYRLDRKAKPDVESISKRWDAFGMQVANFVNSNTDIIVASLFLNIREVSVYTIYFLAINGVKKIVVRITSGVEGALGGIVAEGSVNTLNKNFSVFEFLLNFICIVVFSCLLVLIVPFVNVYTKGISDVNYTRYTFGIIACTAELFYCLRLSYTYLVQAKGAFAETKKHYYIEAVMNILLSVVLVNLLGLVGIVVGTMVAMVYRTVAFAIYVYRHIIEKKLILFVERMFITAINIVINCAVCSLLLSRVALDNYFQLFTYAMPVGIVTLIITVFVHAFKYRDLFQSVADLFVGRISRK